MIQSGETLYQLQKDIATGWSDAEHKRDVCVCGFILNDVYIDCGGYVQDGTFSLELDREGLRKEVGNISIHDCYIADQVRTLIDEYWEETNDMAEELRRNSYGVRDDYKTKILF